MSVLLHSPGEVRSFFKRLHRFMQAQGRDVMLHIAQKLGADAHSHAFPGGEISHFRARRINQLWAQVRKGCWAPSEGR